MWIYFSLCYSKKCIRLVHLKKLFFFLNGKVSEDQDHVSRVFSVLSVTVTGHISYFRFPMFPANLNAICFQASRSEWAIIGDDVLTMMSSIDLRKTSWWPKRDYDT